jgi:hypothetical protein
MAKKGNDILVFVGGTAIAAATTSEPQSEVGMIEVASPTQGQWREYEVGRKGWSISVGCLVLSTSALHMVNRTGIQDLLAIGTKVTLLIKERGAADTTGVTGQAFVKNCRQTYSRGNLVHGSFVFQGTGALSIPATQST